MILTKRGIALDSVRWSGRSMYGNWFFFLFPHADVNLYPEPDRLYGYLHVGWLTISVQWVFWWHKQGKNPPSAVNKLPFDS